ncbi:MAG: hypothetical protein WDZ62_00125 [Candidatus Pacearchaeota archaeon]
MDKKDKNSKLEKFKKSYSVLQKNYDLPTFEEMNNEFHIEKIAEVETEVIIREIRKFVGEKIMNYMRFVENLLNPVNVPMFVFTIVKVMDSDDKKRLSEIYKDLVKVEVKFIQRDLDFEEKEDAKFIISSFKFWQKMKKDLQNILNKIDKKWDRKIVDNSKGYFG